MADLLGTTTPWPTELRPEEKTWGMICHLSSLAGYVIPLGWILGPLIWWQMKKDESSFVDDQGKEALNFAITFAIAIVVCIVLVAVFCIGAFLAPIVGTYALVLQIVAGIKASEGQRFVYPFTIRFVK
ncbi:MAG: DUF4870 domain-containing protein [Planctomycetota bacterium]